MGWASMAEDTLGIATKAIKATKGSVDGRGFEIATKAIKATKANLCGFAVILRCDKSLPSKGPWLGSTGLGFLGLAK